MIQKTPSLTSTLDRIVAECQLNLKWDRYSRDNLTVEGARVLVLQWGVFTRHSRRCWAHVVGNCPHLEVRKFIVTENLYDEEAIEGRSHYDLMVKMGNALGLDWEEVDQSEPLPTTVVALHTWENLTKNRSWHEGLAAKAVLERTNHPECGNFSALQAERWGRQLKLSRDDLEFWTLHDVKDQVHACGAYDLLENYLHEERQRKAAIQAAKESMMAWKVYLDGIYEAAIENSAKKRALHGTA